MATMKQLKQKRSQTKSKVTRFSKFLESYSSENYIELTERLESFDRILTEFDEIQSQLENLLTDDEFERQETERESFENIFYQTKSKAKAIIVKQGNETKIYNDQMQHNLETKNLKLPSMTLPEFNGEYHKWLHFHDTFLALIHQNVRLNNVEKLYYLKGCLKGEASEILQSLDVSDSNYEIAWDLLKQRFENKRVIIEKHVQSMFDYPTMGKDSSASLRKLIDEFNKHIRALKTLGEPTEHWDRLLIHLLSTKLDLTTKREWQEHTVSKQNNVLPKFTDIMTFLNNRFQILEAIKGTNNISKPQNTSEQKRFNDRAHSYFVTQSATCGFCKNSHYIYQCEGFKKLSIQQRYETAKKLKLCTNCLRSNHFSRTCKASSCKHCNKRHNSLLHAEVNVDRSRQNIVDQKENEKTDETVVTDRSSTINTHAVHIKHDVKVLLSTALVLVADYSGAYHEVRVLLDSGSQSNFISSELSQKLQLPLRKIRLPVRGINQSSTEITAGTQAKIKATRNNYEIDLFCLIVPQITDNLPNFTFDTNLLNIPANLTLADPSFHVPSKVDMLLGAGIFWDLMCVGQIRTGPGQPILQKSKLGWILSGPINATHGKSVNKENGVLVNLNLQEQIEKFWKLEEIAESVKMTNEELECEREFLETTKRDELGRFIVKLPTRKGLNGLGESAMAARKRFLNLENKFSKNSELQKQYIDFMNEYQALGHMEKISQSELQNENKLVYYLPHHGVVKESSLTTKLRVVFDASAKTTSNLSLNDVLKVGPKIQDDLLDILLRLRKHNIVMTADIAKMYRQVKITRDQQDLQRILWRSSPIDDLEHFRLTTVTYGTASASYLAIRALHQTAHENKHVFPDATHTILKDFYVDDLITGTSTYEKAIELKRDLTKILENYGFHLRKWVSNERRVLDDSTSNKDKLLEYYITDESGTRALGILWDASTDLLTYKINETNVQARRLTKRIILSHIAQIFDPLGLLAPVTIRAKIIIQKVWQLKLDWDESVPLDIHTECSRFFMSISLVNNFKIQRHCVIKNAVEVHLHGFCDASIEAYGACVYLVSTGANGSVKSYLLCAKSRVAPLKSITLPRLELCGALLLAQLVDRVLKALQMSIASIWCWTDSTIVLHWLAAQPCMWQTFVSNRVSQIQQLSDASNWRHVPSTENPADVISRGTEPQILLESTMWLHGPSWLILSQNEWPRCMEIKVSEDTPLEIRKPKSVCLHALTDFHIFTRFSTFNKLTRIMAYCIRFSKNTKVSHEYRILGALTGEELNNATMVLLKLAQAQEFSQDIDKLKSGRTLQRQSKLLQLNPFLDKDGLIRVGGRLSKASIAYDKKFPVILPQTHALTKLIIKHEHHRHLHAGAQAVLAAVRVNYWPLNGRNAVRSALKGCITCFKVNPRMLEQRMGDLPDFRVNMSRPFLVTGVDYAGPFDIKDGRLRNRKIVKGYLCLFVCFATKAVHMELVGDLSADSFLNAFKRFTARRGICKHLYSDNATNFVGANNKLNQGFHSLLKSSQDFQAYLKQNKVCWHFIPSRSPHHGGLWEAAIKSAKFHMKRVIGKVVLNYEEFYTVIAQIEAVLNSRPLVPLSRDPNDLIALSPSHFLIGDYLTAIPEEVIQTPLNRLRRYKQIQLMTQHFWRRWSREYLSSLQQRTKWNRTSSFQLNPGTMVMLKEDHLPPLLWKIGRVIETHPGSDGLVRVASVRTANGIVKRAVQKICILPIEDE